MDSVTHNQRQQAFPVFENNPSSFASVCGCPGLSAQARLGYRLGSRISLELGYAIAPVRVSVENEGVPLFPGSATGAVHTLAFRPRVRIARIGVATIGYAFAGPAMVWRTGKAFAGNEGTLRGAANVGVGVTFNAGKVRFRVDLEDVIYTSALQRPDGVQAECAVQHDVQLSLGIILLRP